jgi:hypothetical protein
MDEKLCNPLLNGQKLIYPTCYLDYACKRKEGREVLLGEPQGEDKLEAREPLDNRLCIDLWNVAKHKYQTFWR